ncbi:DNA helicase INO80 [Lates japonicus]|uniref:DNA helicase INO80 n=1 Tax=Lates japonicus TaxID=270547 RepID=A0AAD3MRF8_LATJO|nr:DNA helicase INO80 [Lates japonicus]
MSNLMLQGTLVRWLALFLSLKSAYRLHYQRLFGLEEERQEEARDGEGDGGRLQPRIKCLSRKDLILWLNRPTAFPNMHTSPVLQDLVFTAFRPGIVGHRDVKIHSRNSATSTLRPCQPTLPPKFLLAAMPRVTAVPMERYCDDRSAEYKWWVTRGGGGAIFKQCFLYSSPDLASEWRVRANAFHPRCPGGMMALYPRHGWSFIQIPDKESSITEKWQPTPWTSHSRLVARDTESIYSQMTQIDLAGYLQPIAIELPRWTSRPWTGLTGWVRPSRSPWYRFSSVRAPRGEDPPAGQGEEQKKNEESENKRKKDVNLVISHAPSADNSNLSADGDDSFISVEMDSAMPSPFSEISSSSELQPASVYRMRTLTRAERSMLAIVDIRVFHTVVSGHQLPASVSGSVSDNMNGVSASDTISPQRQVRAESGRPKDCGGGPSREEKDAGASSIAGSEQLWRSDGWRAVAPAAAMLLMATVFPKATSASNPLQPSWAGLVLSPVFNPSRSSSQAKGGHSLHTPVPTNSWPTATTTAAMVQSGRARALVVLGLKDALIHTVHT